MGDPALFAKSVLDRLSALETTQFGKITAYSDMTIFERSVLARLVALEINKFGGAGAVPDQTSFTREVLDRLTTLETSNPTAFLSPSVIAFDSAAGWTTGQNPPAISVTLPNDGSIQVGDWYRIEYANNVNFTGSAFGNWYQITSADVLNNGVTGTAYPWGATLAAGATWFRAYMGRGANAGAITLQSVPSNVITDTLNAAAALTTLDPATHESHVVLSNANLTATMPLAWGTQSNTRATLQPSPNDSYFETTVTVGAGSGKYVSVGFVDQSYAIATAGNRPNGAAIGCTYGNDGTLFHDGTFSNATAFTTGDKIGVRYNKTTKVVTFYKNGVAQTPTVTLTIATPYGFVGTNDNGDSITANFGPTFSFLPSGSAAYG